MNEASPLILRTPLMAPELSDFITIEAFDTKTPFNDLIIKYLTIGIKKDSLTSIKHYENTSEYPHYKTVYLSCKIDDFLTNKAKNAKIPKAILFMNYIVAGVEEEKGQLPITLEKWFYSLKSIKV